MKTKLSIFDDYTWVSFVNDIYVSRSMQIYGEWSQGEIQLLSKLISKNQNIVECGSNIGAHTVPLAKEIVPEGKVYAFEPRRQIFQCLCANLSINQIDNCYAFPCGLSDAASFVTEMALDNRDIVNLGGLSIGSLPEGDESFDIIRLDDALPPNLVVSLIKADIEGAELELIRGAGKTINSYRPYLYLENDRRDRSEELLAEIDGLNYDIYWHLVPMFRKENKASFEVNVFENLVSVNILCVPREKLITVKGLEKANDFKRFPEII